jgi:hypothetical protein
LGSDPLVPILKKCRFSLNGKEHIFKQDALNFRTITFYGKHPIVPSKPIYSINFDNSPLNVQPSGTLNLSVADSFQINGESTNLNNGSRISFFASYFNMIIFENGGMYLKYM